MSHLRLTLAVLSSAALLGGAAAGPAAAQDTAGTYPTGPTSGPAGGHGHGPGGRGHRRGGPRKLSDAQLTTIATQLGTTLDALKAAIAKVDAAVKASPERETKAQRDALLATELGVSTDALTAAFEAARPAPGGGDGTGPGRGACKGKPKEDDDAAGTYPTATTRRR